MATRKFKMMYVTHNIFLLVNTCIDTWSLGLSHLIPSLPSSPSCSAWSLSYWNAVSGASPPHFCSGPGHCGAHRWGWVLNRRRWQCATSSSCSPVAEGVGLCHVAAHANGCCSVLSSSTFSMWMFHWRTNFLPTINMQYNTTTIQF